MPELYVGVSGWSYPSWKPGFYPAGTDPRELVAVCQVLEHHPLDAGFLELGQLLSYLRHGAHQGIRAFSLEVGLGIGRVVSADLGHGVGSLEQVHLVRADDAARHQGDHGGLTPGLLPGPSDERDRVRVLGDRRGPVRVQLINARDEGMLELLLGSLDPELRLAFDLAHPTWDGIEPRLAEADAVRVNDLEHDAPFRYVRFRDPPYSEDELKTWADRLRDIDVPIYAYFRHEDEPSAPRYAQRLVELLCAAP